MTTDERKSEAQKESDNMLDVGPREGSSQTQKDDVQMERVGCIEASKEADTPSLEEDMSDNKKADENQWNEETDEFESAATSPQEEGLRESEAPAKKTRTKPKTKGTKSKGSKAKRSKAKGSKTKRSKARGSKTKNSKAKK